MASSAARKPGQLEVPNAAPGVERPKLSTTTTRTTAHRLPPPALFQGPPSKNASHISLVIPNDRPAAEAEGGSQHGGGQRKIIRPSRVPPASSFSGTSPAQLRHPSAGADGDDQRAEQLWAEMQKTLADVEISAMNTSHVFGSSHLRALEELRTAQLSLAKTWAKIEADESLDHDFDIVSQNETDLGATLESKTSATPSSAQQRPAKGTAGAPGTGTTASPATAKDAGSPSDGKPSAFTNDKNLEEETERDIQLARQRREANDRYFSQVNKGVLDVVSKLDEVAGAMRRVERESREIWDESSEDSDDADETGGSDTEGEATDRTGMTDSPVPVRKDGTQDGS
ncbi:uncharacterized protein Z520_06303 [Fonsecaea multimorphosa CBS 102226]|uniref:Uncharacterized protein n=1 Tax=Fonsecaea multimorphosa CBS 102226 TaxID=1442371 RepID=A0A0D2KNC5_9EURO|nr:uncharacterized protein Z520_06303 [Fonsecaea multimorphosa CBS 102226]KIX98223.1 hypothetical protein Z520_06303 [Fonsecaea multimorphosa CBS 102226]OAL22642.1 hypothetical protein AYO22_07200 [Fonsecaea multimorphosa]